ncbi:hypothetical protein [Halomonas daqiaonensis]|uniref:Uncharacterized protein n=1 Tax=Halomonas daqiaonensis TaxID=650850 RepID=A0A1H7HIQ7_9GAMM|nr:hypothetical protein [Halomonas daqiaonensis]SEK50048.1 hypothetical protein SAMN04488129_102227 [Halomonas daqiaonensis]
MFYLKNLQGGRYFGIGSYRPKSISNIYLLHKAGWYGVAVDISTYKIDEMKRFRAGKVMYV